MDRPVSRLKTGEGDVFGHILNVWQRVRWEWEILGMSKTIALIEVRWLEKKTGVTDNRWHSHSKKKSRIIHSCVICCIFFNRESKQKTLVENGMVIENVWKGKQRKTVTYIYIEKEMPSFSNHTASSEAVFSAFILCSRSISWMKVTNTNKYIDMCHKHMQRPSRKLRQWQQTYHRHIHNERNTGNMKRRYRQKERKIETENSRLRKWDL